MKKLNKVAAKTFRNIIAGLNELGAAKEINNNDTYMSVNVDYIDNSKLGKHFTVSHSYIQNGDVMFDPEMVFILAEDNEIYPIEYRQNGLGMYQRALFINDRGRTSVNTKLQNQLKNFANDWMNNIERQQF